MSARGTAAWFLVWTCLVPGLSWAKEQSIQDRCSDRRYDEAGGSMEHVPVVPDGEMSSPGAVVGAELADAYRWSHPKAGTKNVHPGYQTSASEAAFGTADMLHMSLRDALHDQGVDENFVALYLRNNGGCDQALVEADTALKQDLDFINESYEAEEKLRDPNATEDLLKVLDHSCPLTSDRRGELTGNRDALVAAINAETQTRELDARKRFKAICTSAKRVFPGIPAPDSVHKPPPVINPAHPAYTRDLILNLMNSHGWNQPIAIGFCRDLLYYGPTYDGFEPSRFKGRPRTPKKDCPTFAALVIGRRFNTATGKCQVLLQNSFGPECDADKRNDEPYAREWDCDGGKLFVDLDSLAANASDYAYVR